MKTLIRVVLMSVLVLALGTTATAEITREGVPVTLDSSGRYNLTKGVYNAEGTINYPVVTEGQVTLNLSNATIDMKGTEMPAITVEEGSLSLILTGKSKVHGGRTKAGVYVAQGTDLIISGTGELEAFGGDGKDEDPKLFGGGAGIGGNGISYDEDADLLHRYPSFGTVTIEEGTVTAEGGRAFQSNAGAGAGIGGGGMGGVYYDGAFLLQGKVIIRKGTINAYGGEEMIEANTLGGAGIGSGGMGSGDATNCDNQMEIYIYGGTVKAEGGVDGAGIGGGANCDGGDIFIAGGNIEARGSYEVDEDGKLTGISGGAGIGGGDMAGVTNIWIGGNAQVKAFGGGSAAGIGGGKDGILYGRVDIAGSAKVWAHGGTAYHTRYETYFGGAGIGAGAGRYIKPTSSSGDVSITENAYVRAYAGKRAQAIGVGSYFTSSNGTTYGSNLNTVKLRDNIDIWMFNQDDVQPAFWGQTEDGQDLDPSRYTADGLITAWYTNPENAAAFPADGTQVVTSTYPVQESIFWKKLGKEIQISRVVNMIANESAPFEPGNWGTLIKPIEPDQTQVPDIPQTGDDSNLLMWFGLFAGACVVWFCCKKAMHTC